MKNIPLIPLLLVVIAAHSTTTDDGSLVAGSIYSTSSKQCVDIFYGLWSDGTPAQVYDCWNGNNQKFRFVKSSSTGYYQIKASVSAKCLSVYDGDIRRGARIRQYECSDEKSALWKVSGSGSGSSSQIVAAHSGFCLKVGATRYGRAKTLIQGDCSTGDTYWRIDAELHDDDKDEARGYGGTLELPSVGACLHVDKGSTEEESTFGLSTCDEDRAEQDFQFIRCSEEGWYKIMNSKSNLCLCPRHRSVEDKDVVVQADCKEDEDPEADDALLWQVSGTPGQLNIHNRLSLRCLDFDSDSPSDSGTEHNLFQTTCDKETTNEWKVNAEIPGLALGRSQPRRVFSPRPTPLFPGQPGLENAASRVPPMASLPDRVEDSTEQQTDDLRPSVAPIEQRSGREPEPDDVADPDPVDVADPDPVDVADPAPEPDDVADPEPEPDDVADPEPEPDDVADPDPVDVADPEPEADDVSDPAPQPDDVADPTPEPDDVADPEPVPHDGTTSLAITLTEEAAEEKKEEKEEKPKELTGEEGSKDEGPKDKGPKDDEDDEDDHEDDDEDDKDEEDAHDEDEEDADEEDDEDTETDEKRRWHWWGGGHSRGGGSRSGRRRKRARRLRPYVRSQ